MAKFKPASGKKKPAPTKGVIPCAILIVSGIALMSLFFYFMLKSAAS